MRDILTGILLLSGSLFALVSAIGVLRLPDLYNRMHAASKAGTLGAGLTMIALTVHFLKSDVTAQVLAIAAFIIATAPVAAHVIARAAYRTGEPLWEKSVIDEHRDHPQS
ncbi:MAG TPA: monovalent cation/H(+) antiporter subunit G [Candidatus Omnitrophota bacterium]|nr:monovalent cation/H(+) antiporter subunit G [Candidatus Omnitrophota bacterium]